jgi:hypothetical protein
MGVLRGVSHSSGAVGARLVLCNIPDDFQRVALQRKSVRRERWEKAAAAFLQLAIFAGLDRRPLRTLTLKAVDPPQNPHLADDNKNGFSCRILLALCYNND